MALTPGQRFALKKRLIEALEGMGLRDLRLAVQEFGLKKPPDGSATASVQIEISVAGSDDASLIQLAEVIAPDAVPGFESPIEDLFEEQDNSPFSPEEQQQIADAIKQLKEQVRASGELSAEQLHLLEAKLDYLAEAAQRSRRRDWLNIAYGAVASSFAGGILTPDVVHKVLINLAISVGHLFGAPIPQLPSG